MSGTAAPSEGASTNIYQCLSNKGDTRALGKSDLLGGPIIDALLDMPEGTDKILRQVELEERARDLGIKAAFDRLLNSRRKEWQAAMRVRRRELKALQQPVSLQAGLPVPPQGRDRLPHRVIGLQVEGDLQRVGQLFRVVQAIDALDVQP